LGLYQGQLLNWQIVEGLGGAPLEVRVFPGSYKEREEANGAREERFVARKEKGTRRKRIGISDVLMQSRGRDKLRAILIELLADMGLGDLVGRLREIEDVKKGGKGGGGNTERPDAELN
jgi:hypothetical protein